MKYSVVWSFNKSVLFKFTKICEIYSLRNGKTYSFSNWGELINAGHCIYCSIFVYFGFCTALTDFALAKKGNKTLYISAICFTPASLHPTPDLKIASCNHDNWQAITACQQQTLLMNNNAVVSMLSRSSKRKVIFLGL